MEHAYFNPYLDILQDMVVDDMNRELQRRCQKRKCVQKWITKRELLALIKKEI